VDRACDSSREAAQEYSPRRKPWVEEVEEQAPTVRKRSCDTVSFIAALSVPWKTLLIIVEERPFMAASARAEDPSEF